MGEPVYNHSSWVRRRDAGYNGSQECCIKPVTMVWQHRDFPVRSVPRCSRRVDTRKRTVRDPGKENAYAASYLGCPPDVCL